MRLLKYASHHLPGMKFMVAVLETAPPLGAVDGLRGDDRVPHFPTQQDEQMAPTDKDTTTAVGENGASSDRKICTWSCGQEAVEEEVTDEGRCLYYDI
jgi:hypothetical protein